MSRTVHNSYSWLLDEWRNPHHSHDEESILLDAVNFMERGNNSVFANEDGTFILNDMGSPPYISHRRRNIFDGFASVINHGHQDNGFYDFHRIILPEEVKVPVDSSAVANLRTVKARDKNCSVGCDDVCSICLENFVADDKELIVLPCDHVFHESCIGEWFKVNHYCPLCRFELPAAQMLF